MMTGDKAPRLTRRSATAIAALVAALAAGLLTGACHSARPKAASAQIERGRIHFQNYCAACHQPDGSGTKGGPPPLAGSPWVRGPQSRLVRIVLHGLRGPVEVGDATYNLEMLGFGQILQDQDIAAVLTFVRQRFGQPSPAISAETVSRIRADTEDRFEYWTVEELLATP